MTTTMSAQKTRIAKKFNALGLGEFNGVKANGVYRIGSVSFKTLKEIEEYIKGIKESKEQSVEAIAIPGIRVTTSDVEFAQCLTESSASKVQKVAKSLNVPASEIAAEHNATMKSKQDTLRKKQEALLSLPHKDLIDLYNAESKRLAGSLVDAHTVDETCKPLYIVKLMAKLPVRYKMMAETLSNEMAAMSPLSFNESAERKPTEAEKDREVAQLNGSRPFSILR